MRSVTLPRRCHRRWILPCQKWHRWSHLPPQRRDVSLNVARHINGRVTKSVDICSNLYISMEMHEYVSYRSQSRRRRCNDTRGSHDRPGRGWGRAAFGVRLLMVDGLGHDSASRQWVGRRSRVAELVATSQAPDCLGRWGLSSDGRGGSCSDITSSRLSRAMRRWSRMGDRRSTASDVADIPGDGQGRASSGRCGGGVAGGWLAVDGL
jgi:hypothetical protein